MPRHRLQKILAQAGIASRRHAEEFILAGRVSVNGKRVTELGVKADPDFDEIRIDGKVISAERSITLLMNKPREVVTTVRDPAGRQTVVEQIRGLKERLFPIGRLDYSTSGALLLTNDGELAYALTHPRFGVPKTYQVKVRGQVDEDTLNAWRRGVDIGDGMTLPAQVVKLAEEENYTWLEVTLREGRNRQIRRMAEATGLTVAKLKRISFAGLSVDGLKVGQYRSLSSAELKSLHRDYVVPLRKFMKKNKGRSERKTLSSGETRKRT